MSQTSLNDEKGQSLAELALSFIFLLLLVGGVLELGSIMYTSVALRDSAQEGVLYASIHPTDLAGVTARVKTSASFPIDASQIETVSVFCSDGGIDTICFNTKPHSCQGDKIAVTISYKYFPKTPLIGMVWQNLHLTSRVTNTILKSAERATQVPVIAPAPTSTPVPACP